MKTAKEEHLKASVRSFLREPSSDNIELFRFLNDLSSCGSVGIFGGMIRDFLLVGRNNFNSDIDVVIDNDKPYDHLVSSFDLKKNAYGGNRFNIGKWQIDLWSLKDTWAIKNNFVKGCSLRDLTSTTFFNLDAVVYVLRDDALLYKKNYFEDVDSKVLEVNLEPNPNVAGLLDRIPKFLAKGNFRFGPRLNRYIRNYCQHLNFQPNIEDYFRSERRNSAFPQEK